MTTSMTVQPNLAQAIARCILEGFDKHFRIFQEITAGARERFRSADWHGARNAARQRILFYDKRVNETIAVLNERFNFKQIDESLWQQVKVEYVLLLQHHRQPELAETFYTSVFCRMFHRAYFNNNNIFVRSAVSTEYIESDTPAYHVYYPAKLGLWTTIVRIIEQARLALPFEDLARDVQQITNTLSNAIAQQSKRVELNFQFQVLNTMFFRGKAAYVVGKVVNGTDALPLALAILNNERGGLFVDALMLGEKAVSQLFEFSYVYFMAEHPVPSAIVNFLRELMPRRSKEDLYSAIGFQKHGKTDFYRDFLHHLKYSEDEFIAAPGIPGMVMAVFTLPSYDYVFKVIRDRFAPPKETDRKTVEAKYQLVKQHDRVGRMADMLEFSYVALPKRRFSKELLEQLMDICASSIEIEGEQVVIKHVYIERRMIPLNMDMAEADDERLDYLMKNYGEAIKELAAANIFPGDLLFKNFGVTPLGRLVFYDYDEVCYLTDCRFKAFPRAPHPEDEMAAEPWFSVEPNDIFPEEFTSFLLADPRVRKAFMKYHADLLTPELWRQKQRNIEAGIYEDVFPYPPSIRFARPRKRSVRKKRRRR
ncbi:MAG: bifunctional isocitrate dehydrogenase kinase/phosphatase [Pseudomonadota bacterium]|nr:MAG: bifunctional isocitrate dehydrogenase kinase/phosphatase [Pseudomonadota bacterium]